MPSHTLVPVHVVALPARDAFLRFAELPYLANELAKSLPGILFSISRRLIMRMHSYHLDRIIEFNAISLCIEVRFLGIEVRFPGAMLVFQNPVQIHHCDPRAIGVAGIYRWPSKPRFHLDLGIEQMPITSLMSATSTANHMTHGLTIR